jgi:serine-type D-Ala-D-Ala carboxypeptidase/endopeptidase (penicillin-binding protein 4)
VGHRGRSGRSRLLAALVAVACAGVCAAGCSAEASGGSAGGGPPSLAAADTSSTEVAATGTPPTAAAAAPATSPAPTSTPTTTAIAATATTATTVDHAPACPLDAAAAPAPIPDALTAAIEGALAHPGFAGARVGVSVWVEGYGIVAAHDDGVPLLPASNQKLLTAVAALAVLGPDATLTTTLAIGGTRDGGRVDGDLVLIAGGDPTVQASGPHSLDVLAAAVRDAGIVEVTGRLVVDESRHDTRRTADGWFDWHLPAYIGPLSAFTVGGNEHRSDPAFLVDPALGNGELLAAALAAHGVVVTGGVTTGVAPSGATPITTLESAPVRELVRQMLTDSNNTIAELLLREVGLAATGTGSTLAGLEAARDVLVDLCVSVDGVDADGSGLSRDDRRSARAWRELLQAARSQPWGADFVAALPVAGRSGTLTERFLGTVAEGTVRAKTGSILEARALSGYATTVGGRDVVFSVVANADAPGPTVAAIDALVVTLVLHEG